MDPDGLVAQFEEHIVEQDLHSCKLFLAFLSVHGLLRIGFFAVRRYLEHHQLSLEE